MTNDSLCFHNSNCEAIFCIISLVLPDHTYNYKKQSGNARLLPHWKFLFHADFSLQNKFKYPYTHNDH